MKKIIFYALCLFSVLIMSCKSPAAPEKNNKVEIQVATYEDLQKFKFDKSTDYILHLNKEIMSHFELVDFLYEKTNVKEIIIDNDVTEILSGVLGGLLFNKITIPNSVTYIEDCAFYGCENLLEITIPESVTHIGNEVFTESGIKSINVSEKNKNYSSVDGVLYNKEMTSIITCPGKKTGSFKIPSTVKDISNYAFEYCRNLTDVIIPEGIISIGDSAFYFCEGLKNITIPGSVKNIGVAAFQNCTSLEKINILEGLISIGDDAFYGCTELKELKLPSSITSIGTGSFTNCTKLNSIVVSELNNNFSSFDGVLYNKDKSKLIRCPETKVGTMNIPSTVKIIGAYAFSACKDLQDIIIPENLIAVEDFAFENCNMIRQLIIPSTVTVIGNCCFSFCNRLNIIEYKGTKEQWNNLNKDIYTDLSIGCEIKCSDGSIIIKEF